MLQGHKLLIIGTTSRKDMLVDFEMLPLFKTVAHVSAISSTEQLINVLDASEVFSDKELSEVRRQIEGKW